MATKKRISDTFAQLAHAQVEMSSSNTQTSQQIKFAVPLYENFAMLIEQVEYQIDPTDVDLLVANGDKMIVGLSRASSLASFSHSDPRCIDYKVLSTHLYGTPGNQLLLEQPFISDFTQLSGGGLLVPADQLYCIMDSDSIADAYICDFTIRYRLLKLSDAQLIELVQTFQVTT